MNRNTTIRKLLYPLAIVLLIVGFAVGKLLFFGAIAGAVVIYSFVIYSGRKARVRYWFQGYITNLKKNGDDNLKALEAIQQDFCKSKYANDIVCKNKYQGVDVLVQHIITSEFKFDKLMEGSSPASGLAAYTKAKNKLKQEIAEVRKEIIST